MKQFLLGTILCALSLSSITCFSACDNLDVQVVHHWPQTDIVASGGVGFSYKLVNPSAIEIDRFTTEIRDSSDRHVIKTITTHEPDYFVTSYWDTTNHPDAYYRVYGVAQIGNCRISSSPIWVWVNNMGE